MKSIEAMARIENLVKSAFPPDHMYCEDIKEIKRYVKAALDGDGIVSPEDAKTFLEQDPKYDSVIELFSAVTAEEQSPQVACYMMLPDIENENDGLAVFTTKAGKLLVAQIIPCSDYFSCTTRNVLLAIIVSLSEYASETLNLMIYSKDDFITKAFNTWLSNWARNGWLNRDGKPIANIELWKQVYEFKAKIGLRVKAPTGTNLKRFDMIEDAFEKLT